MAFAAATALENAAVGAAVILVLWIHSRPHLITRSEEKTLDAAFGFVEIGLIIAGLAALVSIGSMVLAIREHPGKPSSVYAKKWAWISIFSTVLVALLAVLLARVGEIAGPP